MAERAGVSRATLFRHFPGKAALRAEAERRHGVVAGKKPTARQRLLDAARLFVAQRGLVSATVESIAAEAGVSPVTAYRIFGTREAMILQSLTAVFPSPALREALKESLQRDAPMHEVLQLIARTLLQFAVEYGGIMAMILSPSSEERAEFERTLEQNHGLRAALTEYFARQIEAGNIRDDQPGELAATLFGAAVGLSVPLRERGLISQEEFARQAERIVDRLLHGVVNRP